MSIYYKKHKELWNIDPELFSLSLSLFFFFWLSIHVYLADTVGTIGTIV